MGSMMLTVDSLAFRYPGSPKPALLDVSFTATPGECTLVLGQNGAGKSTLFKLLNGILKPTGGAILVDGLDTRATRTSALARKIAVTFQEPADQIFAATVREEAEFGPRNLSLPHPPDSAKRALEEFGLAESAARHPYDLHPAERKLLTLASAIAMETPIMAFDEPTSGLSHPESVRVVEAFRHELGRGTCLLLATHDLEHLLPLAHRLLIIANGRSTVHDDPRTLSMNERILRNAGMRLPLPWRIARILRMTE